MWRFLLFLDIFSYFHILILIGWYTTITLAVYGTLTKNLAEQVLPPVVAQPAINQQPPPLVTDVQQIVPTQPLEGNWPQDVNINPVQIEYNQPQQPVSYSSSYVQPETYTQVTKIKILEKYLFKLIFPILSTSTLEN